MFQLSQSLLKTWLVKAFNFFLHSSPAAFYITVGDNTNPPKSSHPPFFTDFLLLQTHSAEFEIKGLSYKFIHPISTISTKIKCNHPILAFQVGTPHPLSSVVRNISGNPKAQDKQIHYFNTPSDMLTVPKRTSMIS